MKRFMLSVPGIIAMIGLIALLFLGTTFFATTSFSEESKSREIMQIIISLVVLGAYQRGMVSRWFRASMADVLMRDLKLPLFIAHSK